MSIVVFQHSDTKTPGRLGAALRDNGHRLNIIKLHKNNPVPVNLSGVDGVVSLGGSVNTSGQFTEHSQVQQDEIDFIKQAHESGLPVVGICLGAQLLAKALGGEVGPMDIPEAGWTKVKSSFFGTIDSILAGIPWDVWQFQMHGQEIKTPPTGASVLESSDSCKVQSFKVGSTTYGFQYHFELERQKIDEFIAEHKGALIDKAPIDEKQIKEQTDKYFYLYRQLSDRLCENIALMIFPSLHTTWARNNEPVANYAPHIS